ncbi:hypothetical protein [Nonomuraea diastatica]|uniref:hypothetical protein n=1 Tax=Nonomuraea diastatica TaxID=1848329 RepID=UPI0014083C74|nr:hypothetical protein [Nonomuraea diastatica]
MLPLPARETANHTAMAIVEAIDAVKMPHKPHVIENPVAEWRWRAYWAPPVYFMAMTSATGETVYIPAPAPAQIPTSALGELAKAVAQTRAATAFERSTSEASGAR